MVLKVKKLLLHRIDKLNYQDLSRSLIIKSITKAGIAQLVEHNLAKVGVASSSLVSRSKKSITYVRCLQFVCSWEAVLGGKKKPGAIPGFSFCGVGLGGFAHFILIKLLDENC